MTIEVPETRFARNGSVTLGYQIFGEGPTIMAVPPAFQNADMVWEDPLVRRIFHEYASFSTFLHFDKRGTGISDRSVPVGSLDERADDMRAILDDAGVGEVHLLGVSDGGPMAMIFAATYPQRVRSLVLAASTASFVPREPDHPFGLVPGRDWLERWQECMGTADTITLDVFAPSLAGDEAYRRWYARYERQSCGPDGRRRIGAMNRSVDVRHVLPAITTPTLVLHRRGDRLLSVETSRYLAAHIPGARLVELDGEDHFLHAGDIQAWLDEVREFVTGTRAAPSATRFLATVLLTDLVGSTEQAARVGDQEWMRRLDAHDDSCRRIIERHGGCLVKSTGDGVLAWFDGPARAVRSAVELRDELARVGLTCRAGLHAGEIEQRGDDIGGIAVHIAARVEAAAGPGEVLATRTVKDLVTGSRITFQDRGMHRLKGVEEEWQLLAVTNAGVG